MEARVLSHFTTAEHQPLARTCTEIYGHGLEPLLDDGHGSRAAAVETSHTPTKLDQFVSDRWATKTSGTKMNQRGGAGHKRGTHAHERKHSIGGGMFGRVIVKVQARGVTPTQTLPPY